MSNIIVPQGWAILRLKDIAEIRMGKNIDSKYFNREHLGLPYITGASNIQAGVLEIDRWTQHEGGIISRRNDIIISRVGTLGKIGINQIGDAVLSGHCFALSPLPGVRHEYLLTILGFNLPKIIPADDGEGGTGFSRKLEKETLEQLELGLPPEPEQERITSRLITLAEAFIPAEKKYKQAARRDLPPGYERMSSRQLIKEIQKLDRECARSLKELAAMLPEDCELAQELKQEQGLLNF